jgi:hypothetical protein
VALLAGRVADSRAATTLRRSGAACIDRRARGCVRREGDGTSASPACCCIERRQRESNREKSVAKCVACQFYDRNEAHAEDKGVRWGKCRRTGPIVHPMSAKAYMVEGIWPSVRDDDWCGEWTAAKRKGDSMASDPRNLLMQPAAVRPGPISASLMTPLNPSAEATATGTSGRFGSD